MQTIHEKLIRRLTWKIDIIVSIFCFLLTCEEIRIFNNSQTLTKCIFTCYDYDVEWCNNLLIRRKSKLCKTKKVFLYLLSKLSFWSNNVHYLFCSKLVCCVRLILCIEIWVFANYTTITFLLSVFGVNYVFQGFRQVKVQSLKLAWFMILNATPLFQVLYKKD